MLNKVFLIITYSCALNIIISRSYANMVCPPGIPTAEDLVSFRKNLIKKNDFKNLVSEIKKCFPIKAPLCYQDMIYYGEAMSGKHDLRASNYYDDSELSIQSEKELPEGFFDPQKPNKVIIPKDIFEREKQDPKKYQILQYQTRSSGGFDNSINLFIIVVKTPDKDFIFQTSPHETPLSNPRSNLPLSENEILNSKNNLTLITVDKTTKPHDKTTKPQVAQLRKLVKMGEDYNWETKTESVDSCFSCHTGPLRAISPKGYSEINSSEKKLSLEDHKKIEAINLTLEEFKSWGTTKRGQYDIKLGAAMNSQPYGWATDSSKTRSEKFIKQCSTNEKQIRYKGFSGYVFNVNLTESPAINYKNVALAMNCYECHNNRLHGALHSNFSFDEIVFKVLVDRSMPFILLSSLSMNDRIALVNCLKEEFGNRKNRRKWIEEAPFLTTASCDGDQFKHNNDYKESKDTGAVPIENMKVNSN